MGSTNARKNEMKRAAEEQVWLVLRVQRTKGRFINTHFHKWFSRFKGFGQRPFLIDPADPNRPDRPSEREATTQEPGLIIHSSVTGRERRTDGDRL